MTKKQSIIYNFILQNNKSATIREVIDFCKKNENFNGYIPESAKQVYCSLIKKGILTREDNNLKITLENCINNQMFFCL